jgi:hypothetical protein
MLPSDPGYVSAAPEHLRQHPLLLRMLADNIDPWAEHWPRPELQRIVEGADPAPVA